MSSARDNANILIVDDDPDFAAMIKVALEGDNYAVGTAPGRAEGMERIEASKPDLLILDVMMAARSPSNARKVAAPRSS